MRTTRYGIGSASAVLLALAVATNHAQIEPAKDAPQPHTPEQSIRMFHLKPGFRIELVAAEPLLADPVDIDFDPRGRIFVAELHGYNMEGYYDIVELNKTGKLDTQVRRIPATDEAKKRAEPEMYGTVKLLIDRDGDGRMDEAQVWADRLPPCYGVASARGGVVALCPPDIYFLADRDGDGTAEVKQTLFTGLNVWEMWARSNNLRHGLDGWIYAVGGRGGAGAVTGPNLPAPVEIGVRNYRFKADGSALEPVTGSASGFGQSQTDWGDRFAIANSIVGFHVNPLEHRYLARNPYIGSPQDHDGLAGYRQVFPTSKPHPWRVRRGSEAAWVKFYGAGEATPNGNLTAACSPFIYQAQAFPKEYWGSYFCCESQQNMIHHAVLYEDGAAYRAKRADDEQDREFLTSDEGWFRPVNLRLGPDGGMYIVDMYREIIEDYSAIPRYLQQQYGLNKGLDRGRIWRVTHEDAPKAAKPALDTTPTAELVAQLENPNAWWRLTAQRLLVERGDKAAVESLRQLARSSESPLARMHAMYTLGLLGAMDGEIALAGVSDAHPGVRLHALRLAEPYLDRTSELLDRVAAMTDDPDAKVRLQLAMTLGESRDEKAIAALGRLGAKHGAERWMDAAIASSAVNTADRLLEAVLSAEGDDVNRAALIRPLAATVGARRQDAEVSRVLATAARLGRAGSTPLQLATLTGLIEGLRHGKAARLESADGQRAVTQLLAAEDEKVHQAAFELVGLLRLNDSPILREAFDRAAQRALDESLDPAVRLNELNLLSNAPFEQRVGPATKLMDARHPPRLQLAAVKAIAESDDPGVPSALLAGWAGHSPAVRQAVLDALFARNDRLPAVLDAMLGGVVTASNLSAFQRVHLLENADAKIRDRAKTLLTDRPTDANREKLLQQYRQALAAQSDASRGRELFMQVCAVCHQIDGMGGNVGPDLSSANGRADETLLADILLPNDQITVGYRTYIVETTDGKVVAGNLASETATSVVLRQPMMDDQVVLRRDIQRLTATDQSLMPERLDQTLNPRDVADIVAFLRDKFGRDAKRRLVLFDDEEDFVRKLPEGDGTANLDGDGFVGKYSLAITPPQKFSAAIPGYNYRITENPAAGEFRYLRMAWKAQPQAHGVMLEIAADGRWPDSKSPVRRYYSGRNTTPWQATRIAAEAPRQWTAVTIDLWKDCGPFTLTGLAPTAMGGTVLFDRIELLRSLDDVEAGR